MSRRGSLLGKKITSHTPYPVFPEPILQTHEEKILEWFKDLVLQNAASFSKDTVSFIKEQKSFAESIADGVILCELCNLVQPNVIPKINLSARKKVFRFNSVENFKNFNKACTGDLKMDGRFIPSEAEFQQNAERNKTLSCIKLVAQLLASKSIKPELAIPGDPGPRTNRRDSFQSAVSPLALDNSSPSSDGGSQADEYTEDEAVTVAPIAATGTSIPSSPSSTSTTTPLSTSPSSSSPVKILVGRNRSGRATSVTAIVEPISSSPPPRAAVAAPAVAEDEYDEYYDDEPPAEASSSQKAAEDEDKERQKMIETRHRRRIIGKSSFSKEKSEKKEEVQPQPPVEEVKEVKEVKEESEGKKEGDAESERKQFENKLKRRIIKPSQIPKPKPQEEEAVKSNEQAEEQKKQEDLQKQKEEEEKALALKKEQEEQQEKERLQKIEEEEKARLQKEEEERLQKEQEAQRQKEKEEEEARQLALKQKAEEEEKQRQLLLQKQKEEEEEKERQRQLEIQKQKEEEARQLEIKRKEEEARQRQELLRQEAELQKQLELKRQQEAEEAEQKRLIELQLQKEAEEKERREFNERLVSTLDSLVEKQDIQGLEKSLAEYQQTDKSKLDKSSIEKLKDFSKKLDVMRNQDHAANDLLKFVNKNDREHLVAALESNRRKTVVMKSLKGAINVAKLLSERHSQALKTADSLIASLAPKQAIQSFVKGEGAVLPPKDISDITAKWRDAVAKDLTSKLNQAVESEDTTPISSLISTANEELDLASDEQLIVELKASIQKAEEFSKRKEQLSCEAQEALKQRNLEKLREVQSGLVSVKSLKPILDEVLGMIKGIEYQNEMTEKLQNGINSRDAVLLRQLVVQAQSSAVAQHLEALVAQAKEIINQTNEEEQAKQALVSATNEKDLERIQASLRAAKKLKHISVSMKEVMKLAEKAKTAIVIQEETRVSFNAIIQTKNAAAISSKLTEVEEKYSSALEKEIATAKKFLNDQQKAKEEFKSLVLQNALFEAVTNFVSANQDSFTPEELSNFKKEWIQARASQFSKQMNDAIAAEDLSKISLLQQQIKDAKEKYLTADEQLQAAEQGAIELVKSVESAKKVLSEAVAQREKVKLEACISVTSKFKSLAAEVKAALELSDLISKEQMARLALQQAIKSNNVASIQQAIEQAQGIKSNFLAADIQKATEVMRKQQSQEEIIAQLEKNLSQALKSLDPMTERTNLINECGKYEKLKQLVTNAKKLSQQQQAALAEAQKQIIPSCHEKASFDKWMKAAASIFCASTLADISKDWSQQRLVDFNTKLDAAVLKEDEKQIRALASEFQSRQKEGTFKEGEDSNVKAALVLLDELDQVKKSVTSAIAARDKVVLAALIEKVSAFKSLGDLKNEAAEVLSVVQEQEKLSADLQHVIQHGTVEQIARQIEKAEKSRAKSFLRDLLRQASERKKKIIDDEIALEQLRKKEEEARQKLLQEQLAAAEEYARAFAAQEAAEAQAQQADQQVKEEPQPTPVSPPSQESAPATTVKVEAKPTSCLDSLRKSFNILLQQNAQSQSLTVITRDTQGYEEFLKSLAMVLVDKIRKKYIFFPRTIIDVFYNSPFVEIDQAVKKFDSSKIISAFRSKYAKLPILSTRTDSEILLEFMLDQRVLPKYIAYMVKDPAYLMECFDSTSVLCDKKFLPDVKQIFNDINKIRFDLGFPATLFEKQLWELSIIIEEIVENSQSKKDQQLHQIIHHDFIPLLEEMLSYDIKPVPMTIHKKASSFELLFHVWDVIEFASGLLQEIDIDYAESSTVTVISAAATVKTIVEKEQQLLALQQKSIDILDIKSINFSLFVRYALNNQRLDHFVRTLLADNKHQRFLKNFFKPSTPLLKKKHQTTLLAELAKLNTLQFQLDMLVQTAETEKEATTKQ